MFYTISLLFIFIFITLLAFLFFTSKGVMAKLQISNTFGGITVTFITVFLYSINKEEFIDIALLYALLNYIGVIAYRRYFNLHILREQKEYSNSIRKNEK